MIYAISDALFTACRNYSTFDWPSLNAGTSTHCLTFIYVSPRSSRRYPPSFSSSILLCSEQWIFSAVHQTEAHLYIRPTEL